MDERYEVRWNGQTVGFFTIVENDMWYYGGKFIAELSPAGTEFKNKINALHVGTVFNDFGKGLPVTMHPQNKPEDEWQVILMGFKDEKLHLRAVTYITQE